MAVGYCYPVGLAFDKAGNLWYVDYLQGWEVELTKASHYSKVGSTPRICTPGLGCDLIDIVIDSAGNHWVSDYSCTGNVYENGVVKFSAGDMLWGIQISTLNPSKKAHLYVAVTNKCGNYPYPFVGDVSDLTILPHPCTTGADIMFAISTLLYFTDYTYGYVWLTAEP
jgi:DNA-binding beta-propeller fold protein YncE